MTVAVMYSGTFVTIKLVEVSTRVVSTPETVLTTVIGQREVEVDRT